MLEFLQSLPTDDQARIWTIFMTGWILGLLTSLIIEGMRDKN